jgi:hypothetical protein
VSNIPNHAKYSEAAARPFVVEKMWRYAKRVESGCLEWQRGLSKTGYAITSNMGVTLSAHRLAWWVTYGPVEGDLVVDHICFNHRCIEPTHLQLLTSLENSRRQSSAEKPRCKRGHLRTPENIYEWTKPTGRVLRNCRICSRETDRATQLDRRRRWRAKRKALGLKPGEPMPRTELRQAALSAE